MAQVKFYSKSSLPTGDALDQNGVYFIQGGELYKGSQRFGLGRVTAGEAHPANPARGDIDFLNAVPWVWDGTEWKKLGGDAADVRAIVSSMTSGLVAGGNGSYITGIVQDANGNVTASAEAFPTFATGDADGQVKLGSTNVKVSGWDALVTSVGSNTTAIAGLSTTLASVSSRVTGLEGIVDVSNSKVTATTGSFTNLTVTDTATFSATVVSANTLTVGGTPVNNVSAASATDSDAGVAVTVSTLGGGVSAVGVTVTSATLLTSLALTPFAGKTVATAIGPSEGTGAATDNEVATALAVRKAIATLDNAMHFKGVVTELPANGEPGDIVVIGAIPVDPFIAAGQEYICTASATETTEVKWELIGDQHSVTGGDDSDVKNGITVSVGITAATAAPDVTLTVDAVSVATDVSVAGKASNVVTAGAVAGFVGDSITSAMSYTSTATVYTNVSTVPGALSAAGAAIDTLKSKTDAYVGGTNTGTWKPTGATNDVISTTVAINSSTMAPTVTMNVDVDELRAALGVTTTVSDSSSTKLTTEGAVKTYVDTALSWITD